MRSIGSATRQTMLLAALALASAEGLAAQQVDRPGASFSVDASVGAGGLAGGNYLHRTSLALDATVARRLGIANGGLLIALSGGVQTPLGNAQACAGGGGECFGEHPTFYSIGALFGWEHANGSGPGFRLLAGPAMYDPGDAGPGTAAMQARIDVATPPFAHLALVLSARGAWLPDVDGDGIGLGAIGIGLRIR